MKKGGKLHIFSPMVKSMHIFSPFDLTKLQKKDLKFPIEFEYVSLGTCGLVPWLNQVNPRVQGSGFIVVNCIKLKPQALCNFSFFLKIQEKKVVYYVLNDKDHKPEQVV